MEKTKLRIVIDYNKLHDEVKIKLHNEYPEGFYDYLFQYRNARHKLTHALILETDDIVYIIKVPTSLVNDIKNKKITKNM